MTRITLQAFAKINLNLKVIGRRPDGFHELETIVQTITLHDRIDLEGAQDGIELEVDDATIPADATNLACRAAAALPRASSGPQGVRIRLVKGIPSGAGLGGGSSDAAATLVGVSRLRRLPIDPEILLPLACSLGSDVPFFLTGGTALLTGRGTEVRPLPDRTGYSLLLVFPGAGISTPAVYAQLHAPLTPEDKIGSMTRFRPTLMGEVEACVGTGNDLEPYARVLCPAIGEIKERLLRSGATAAAMTGSGSAVFGLFRDPVARERAADEMEAAGWSTARCAPLGRQEYRTRLGLI
ncbi:MAG TPA: 4-(cytidine 5'-diphospho)-2-C-methyl-D-erythritol kinase [Candidatus Polarisedimenticolia bacterium]|nr:4-(cytidine 5'-diphospho)-2-C-methyl-D-erythritol kinase [Candidatus Polarisedimenticolia bacterium]